MAYVPSRTRKKIDWLFRRAEGALLGDGVLAAEGAHLAADEARRMLGDSAREVADVGATARREHLERAITGADASSSAAYIDQHGVCGVRRFHTSNASTRIYLLSIETLPKHVNNLYLVLDGGTGGGHAHALLLDCGSGFESSRRDLALAFAIVRSVFHEAVRYAELDECLVSHAHIDHFGGANRIKEETRARLAVHELDARVLACFDERLVVASKDLDVYWRRAGIDDEERAALMTRYGAMKSLFRPQEVDRVLRDGDTLGPGYRVHHVPGHCPGLVCLQVHDVLLTSDHVLAKTTPHQFPQAITPFAGLEHYFHSLSKIRKLEGINFALGGHEEPIWDLRTRIDAIALFHRDRLAKVMAMCGEPKTIVEITKAMFGDQEGYGRLLAIEEAGAHVEYLHDLGKLKIANLDEVARARDPIIQYVAR